MRSDMRLRLATITAALIGLSTAANAEDCAPIESSGEFESLAIGDTVYPNIATRLQMIVESIDREARQVCGKVRGREKCYNASMLYTEEGVDACVEEAKEKDPLDVGIIFLYEENQKTDAQPTED